MTKCEAPNCSEKAEYTIDPFDEENKTNVCEFHLLSRIKMQDYITVKLLEG